MSWTLRLYGQGITVQKNCTGKESSELTFPTTASITRSGRWKETGEKLGGAVLVAGEPRRRQPRGDEGWQREVAAKSTEASGGWRQWRRVRER